MKEVNKLIFIKINIVLEGEIAMVIMLYRTNILALVGSDNNMNHNRSKLIIWDDHQKKPLSELKFNQNIMNVKLRKDKIIVVCRDKIYVFNLSTFKNMDIIETGDNSHGIVAVSYGPEEAILAYPDKEKGKIRIKSYENQSVFFIDAHQNNIAYIALSYDGNLVATASEQGTLIRIFSTKSGNLLQEVRRGKDKADIKYICFEPNLKFLAASSSKGTIHIWSLSNALKQLNREESSETVEFVENKTSILNWLPKSLGGQYFNSEWSFAQVRITDQRSICCFGADNTIIIVSTEGKYYKAAFDVKNGGDCKIIQEEALI